MSSWSPRHGQMLPGPRLRLSRWPRHRGHTDGFTPALGPEQNQVLHPPALTAPPLIPTHLRRMGARPSPQGPSPGREGWRAGPRLGCPSPALAAAPSQVSAHSGGSRAAACAPCPASLLQIPRGPSGWVKGSTGTALGPGWEVDRSLPQFSRLQIERTTLPHPLNSAKATHQTRSGPDCSPVGSLKTTLASITLRLRDLIITAMWGTLFLGSCFRAAWLRGEAFAEQAASHQ